MRSGEMWISFLPGRLVNVSRWRGRKFVYRPSIVIGHWRGEIKPISAEELASRRNVVSFRGEPEIPGGPAEWGTHSLSAPVNSGNT